MNIRRLFSLVLVLLISFFTLPMAWAQDEVTQVTVTAGDNEGLIEAISEANLRPGQTRIIVEPGPMDETGFVFDGPAPGSDSALPAIVRRIEIKPSQELSSRVTFETTGDAVQQIRLTTVGGMSVEAGLFLNQCSISGFGTQTDDGGAILVRENGVLGAQFTWFSNNFAVGNGGAVAAVENGIIGILSGSFIGNNAGTSGGAISNRGGTMSVIYATFTQNNATAFGCDIHVDAPDSELASSIIDSSFNSGCSKVAIENPAGKLTLEGNSFESQGDTINSTDDVDLFLNVFGLAPPPVKQRNGSTQPSKQALCNDFGTDAFNSLGYNIAADESCGLDQETDITGIDPLTGSNGDGVIVPQAGSPVIDAGPKQAMVIGDDPRVRLPCNYVDLNGTARPQDGNGDGEFECDMGAVEHVGDGEFLWAHSGAYFDPFRNGEGTFVENLGNGFATIYTFTYRPDGSGPAWFIGVGEVSGNQVVIDENLRPSGTSFGDGFNANDIVLNPAGSMSMIVPDCSMGVPGGVTAFTGDEDSGYEGLIARAVRVSKIVRCVDESENVNAGLSGSWFDPARNGEGLIVQWLDFGDVLAIFFTYDENGDQMWMIGQGTPTGKTVSMEALYPAMGTQWGSGFVPGDISLQTWGKFDLNWTECGKMTFTYNADVGNYGSATRDYIRLSTLAGTECPQFLPVE